MDGCWFILRHTIMHGLQDMLLYKITWCG